MKITGRISQLESDYGRAYLNIENGDGFVSVWASAFDRPTILVQAGAIFKVMTFDSEEYLVEWLQENEELVAKSKITRLSS